MEMLCKCQSSGVSPAVCCSAAELFVAEAALAVEKILLSLVLAMGSLSFQSDSLIELPETIYRILQKSKHESVPENKDDGDSEEDEEDDGDDDQDGDDQEEYGGEGDPSGEENDNEDDENEDPEANGEGGSDEDDDEGDEDDDGDESDEEDEEDDEEELLKPPTKKRK
ncbi:prostatic spermine-binding protein-like [Zingiber officinale]|uniref:Uncharacterized protein n=1 Tax=Zingiber officinale TaxID=94328 RepID=A0A8J5K8T4_ZINOF|nr:prostatic spermine-binding protein-like [Zingiber officinale]XP_042440396.1 prostatic spermine-binding protein-like [Zingiber officinale]KAG6475980.1 hypothetical protein ZIOFF_065214 [Zingiber officinale]